MTFKSFAIDILRLFIDSLVEKKHDKMMTVANLFPDYLINCFSMTR